MMEEDDKKLDLIKFLTHIKQYHPTKRLDEADANDPKENRFGICETLGTLALCKCCVSETSDMSK